MRMPREESQAKILAFIREEMQSKGYPPSVREICKAVGFKSTSSVHAHLQQLEKSGALHRDAAKPRALELSDYPKGRLVPLVGKVTAGVPNAYIEIESVVLQTDISGKGISYVKDEEGSHAWYTDEKVLKKEGKPGLRSEAYRVVYSIATGEEISREKLSTDSYQPENDTYWVGVHER